MIGAAIIGGVAGLAQLGMGIADKIKAAKKQKEAQSFWEKNKYQIPESAKSQLALAERSAAGLRLPGQDIMEENIRTSTAQGVQDAKEAAMTGGDVLGMLSQVYSGQQNQFKQLGLEAAQNYQQRQQYLGSVLGQMAGYEQQKWQYNSLYPYQQMLGQAEAYGNRGAQQINSGLGSIAGAAGMFMQGQAAQKQLGIMEKYYGVGSGSPTASAHQALTPPMPMIQTQPQQRMMDIPGQFGYTYSDFNTYNR